MGEAGGAEESRRRAGTEEEFVKVRKKDLERLTTEVMQIRDFLPRILNGEVLESFQKLKIVGKNLESKEQELEQLRLDCEHFKARLESVQVDNVREKKEKLALRQQLNEAKQQLLQQAEYCTEMGAAACTILWGVSSSEEVVKAILGGDKALKFFNITGQTMESFVKSLDGDVKELDSDENQFVFALAGIVTNVAAIASGREFLVNSSRVLLDTILQLLGDLKPGQCTKLKVSFSESQMLSWRRLLVYLTVFRLTPEPQSCFGYASGPLGIPAQGGLRQVFPSPWPPPAFPVILVTSQNGAFFTEGEPALTPPEDHSLPKGLLLVWWIWTDALSAHRGPWALSSRIFSL
ncbi:heat shock factor 2-binding protein isoform X3 [Hippopotamus amphibius kiboko]|uniref:heat shock factor 2-binding protein isoform X3 n=1 Tax=Hippopotamus amphibius kiboko TaxID=575201 RepID=UPI0025941A70|nr:heat shock factor 2-binding protein isoform X3 [Hippopotamus amphibius kiboko]XP_057552116.1 heat shock factor 2-binding protein isoform X3 [Hippopotamus amphibius kiboko]